MPVDIDRLRDELTDDPVAMGYSGMNDVSATEALNSQDRDMLGPVGMTALREWAAIGARAFKVRRGIADPALSNQVRSLCIIADQLLGTDDGVLDPSNQKHLDLVNELVAAGVLSATDRTALAQKATTIVSRAAEIGLPRIRSGNVMEARL
jgi:hypothetical protein